MKKLLVVLTVVFSLELNAQPYINVVGQTWMKYDLKVYTFQNGDSIYIAKSNEDWLNATASEKPALCIEYGGFFYNHYAVSDKRGLAPKGYRIPTKKDIEIIRKKLSRILFDESRHPNKFEQHITVIKNYLISELT